MGFESAGDARRASGQDPSGRRRRGEDGGAGPAVLACNRCLITACNLSSGPISPSTAKIDGWAGYLDAPGVNHDPHVVSGMAAHLVLPCLSATIRNGHSWSTRVEEAEASRLMHAPMAEQQRWYASILRGHRAYYGLP